MGASYLRRNYDTTNRKGKILSSCHTDVRDPQHEGSAH